MPTAGLCLQRTVPHGPGLCPSLLSLVAREHQEPQPCRCFPASLCSLVLTTVHHCPLSTSSPEQGLSILFASLTLAPKAVPTVKKESNKSLERA